MLCQQEEREAGRLYPRTCPTCRIGPCQKLGEKPLQSLSDDQAEIDRLTAERDAAIKALCESAKAKGQAEGKLAASEMAGVIEGWKTRAEKAEAEVEHMRTVLNEIKLRAINALHRKERDE